MTKRVAVIFLTFYDTPHYIDEAVLSLVESSYPKELLTFVVVDNSQHGASADYVRKTVVPRSGKDLPEVVFIENNENEGFAEGNNQGIRWAMEHDYDYVFLLNNDAKLETDTLEKTVEVMESDDSIGAVQALMLLWQKPNIINSSGNDMHYLGFGVTRDYGKPKDQVSRDDREEVGYTSGAAVLYRLKALKDVGLLETYFWMYHEDLELSWRLRLRGWKSVLAKNAIVYHDYSFSRSTQKMFWMERNRWLTHLTHLRFKTLFLLLPALLFMEIFVIGGSLLGGWFGKKLQSYASILKPASLNYMWTKRARVKELRQVSDKEALALCVSTIDHQEVSNPLLRLVVNPLISLYWKLVRRFI